jgi:hypothetical protein
MRGWWMEITLPPHPHVPIGFETDDTPALRFSSTADAHGGNTLLLDEDIVTSDRASSRVRSEPRLLRRQ